MTENIHAYLAENGVKQELLKACEEEEILTFNDFAILSDE